MYKSPFTNGCLAEIAPELHRGQQTSPWCAEQPSAPGHWWGALMTGPHCLPPCPAHNALSSQGKVALVRP